MSSGYIKRFENLNYKKACIIVFIKCVSVSFGGYFWVLKIWFCGLIEMKQDELISNTLFFKAESKCISHF